MIPPTWPAASLAEIQARLCAPGELFEMETRSIRGIPTRTWKNAPATVRALVAASRDHGDRLVTIFEEERVTYEAQHRAVAALATALAARGIGRGDRVALAMQNLPEWPVAFFAVVSLGTIAVPLNAWWTGGELAYGLADSGAVALIADAARWERVAPSRPELPDLKTIIVARADNELGDAIERLEGLIGRSTAWPSLPNGELPAVPIDPDDDATIFYTSGTTGRPKGAIGTHRNLATNVFSLAYVGVRTALRRGDAVPTPAPRTALIVTPLFHVTACAAGLMTATAAGNTTIYMRRWDALEALRIIERERVAVTGGVPTIAWQLLEHPERQRFDLSSLESIGYGGAPSAPELVHRLRDEFGVMPANGWGMTETMATVTSHAAEDYLNRPESCGPAVPVADLRIVAEDGATTLPTGVVGELWARGPQVGRGYWRKPEATAETFVDGWVRTGDLARLDDEGFCYVVDRRKDVIIRAGENIYSSEVENVLYAHPAVMDAAVVGLPHRTLGEVPAAAVLLAPGRQADVEELQAWVGRHLGRFNVPTQILLLDRPLPRNANGKLMKNQIKDLMGELSPGEAR